MNRVSIFPNITTQLFLIPMGVTSNIYVDVGDRVGVGQKLFDAKRKSIVDSYYLPKVLGNKVEDSGDYVGRISGEYISKGELLAEKLSAGGMVGKRVISGVDGVINLDRVKLGYIDILGEEETIEVYSSIEGLVEELSLNSHILIKALSATINVADIFNVKSGIAPRSDIFSAELVTVEDGSSVYTSRSLKDSYEGKIVYAGRFLYPDTAKEIYKRGAVAIVTYSTDYESVESIELPIVVVGGYGLSSGHYDLTNLISENVGHLIKLDSVSKKIHISNGDLVNVGSEKMGQRFKDSLEEGDFVNIISSQNFGTKGSVIEVYRHDGETSCLVETSGGSRLVLHEEELDHYISIV